MYPLNGVKRFLCTICFLAAIPQQGGAVRGVENYPKVLGYSSAMNLLPESVQDTLAWYDVLVCVDRPLTIQNLRQRNPDQKYLWMAMPQHADAFEGDDAWWVPDTLWSFKRLVSVYAAKNDWYLKDTQGRVITDGNHLIVNWTEHCPPGVFGSSKGLRAAEWVATHALPDIALSGRYWEPWSWDSNTAYNGFMFEILVDCLGSYGWQTYAQADPDQDGVAEGVYSTCSTGGADDPLSVLFRAENEIFFQLLGETFPPEFVFTINENSNYLGPWWRTRLSGMKLENWMRGCCPSWADWWDYFYGITPPYDPGDNWGVGYLWAEWAFDKPVEDRLRGWDLSWVQTWEEARLPRQENLRQMRFGLGTAMLGDGYFCYTRDQRMPEWQPEFDWDFGMPLGDFVREPQDSDTLYTRFFDLGMVEVNPATKLIQGVPARDTRFTFWLPVQDLAAEELGEHAVRVAWTTPDGVHNDADSFELRYAEGPLEVEDWGSARPYEGNPIVAAPGSRVELQIDGLEAGTEYHFAVRTRTRGRLEPLLSNPASATTIVTVDTTPPGAAGGLRLIDAGSNYLQIGWTASGDDGNTGTATRTRIRHRRGAEIESEADWNTATPVDPPHSPPPAGGADSHRLSGLSAGSLYGIAVRLEDEAGNLGPLHAPFNARTADPPPPPPPDDTTPPAAVADLAAAPAGQGEVDLAWTAPGDDGLSGRADAYEVRYLMGRAIATTSDWSAATSVPPPLPEPAPSGVPESLRVTGLKPGAQYGFAVRARDESGNIAGLSNPATATAGESAPPPPELDEAAPDAIADLAVIHITETTAELAWTAPGDDGDEGTAASYELGLLQGRAIATEEEWLIASRPADSNMTRPAEAGTPQSTVLRALQSGTLYGVAIRARDDAGNLGGLHAPVTFTTLLSPPPPEGGDDEPVDTTPPSAIVDLAVAWAETTRVLLVWTAPADSGSAGASLYRLRMAPIETPQERVWADGDSVPAPNPSAPGSKDSVLVTGLRPGTGYAFAIRGQDPSGNLSGASNVASVETPLPPPPPPPPPRPPDPIADLRLLAAGSDSAIVAWTAPGDDGSNGTAQRYLARIRQDGPIETEEDWLASGEPDTTGLPRPSIAGSLETWTLRSLASGTRYALSLRAEDDSLLAGPLGPSLLFETGEESPPLPAPILDLTVVRVDPAGCDLRWTSPAAGNESESVVRLRVVTREGLDPIATEDDWKSAVPWDGDLPSPSPPGTIDSLRLEPLAPGRVYAVAMRAEDASGRLGALGNSPTAAIPELPDTTEIPPPEIDIPPAPILDLAAAPLTPDSLELRWTAVGEDSLIGRASEVLVRLLQGERIETAEDWDRASAASALSDPLPSGSPERLVLGGFLPGTAYGIAVRAADAAGQLSPFVAGAWVRMPEAEEPPDTLAALLPPEDFAVVAVDERSATIRFRHPVGAGALDAPSSFAVALSETPLDESTWAQALLHPDPPAPGAAGETRTIRWEDLAPGSVYWSAARAVGTLGRISPLSNLVRFEVPSIDLAPPQPPSAVRVTPLPDAAGARIEWEASSDPDLAGYFVEWQDPGGEWNRWSGGPIPPSAREATLAIRAEAYAVIAVDASGNESARSVARVMEAGALRLDGPYPHPVTTECRFEISLPLGSAGSEVRLTFRDMEGRVVRRIETTGGQAWGALEVRWDRTDAAGRPAAPGLYLLTLEAAGQKIQRRIFLAP